MSDKHILTILGEIQRKLNVPKGQTNKFGGYKYRSCEDILEASKTVLEKYNATLILSDELHLRGDRYYIQATATLHVGEASVSATGYAREAAIKKGMDESQITGAASSYARKYALNGLLAIDDTKDADTNEHKTEATKRPDPIIAQIKKCGDMEQLKTYWAKLTDVQKKEYSQEKDLHKATLEGVSP